MRLFLALTLLLLSTLSSSLLAQLQVGTQLARSTFLQFERVDVTVTLTNTSDADLLLNNDEGPWIRFLITNRGGAPVKSEGRATFPPLSLKPGETKNITINVTPLYAFRELNNYRVAGVVHIPGQGDLISQAADFELLQGHQVWTESRTLDGSERLFSLLTFSPLPDRTMLYLRVVNPAENVVYTNLALGNIASAMEPEVHLDAHNNIHILQCIAMSTYLYSRADVKGKIVHQAVFKTFHEIPPHLAVLDGNEIVVKGGLEETEANRPDLLSDAQEGKKLSSVGAAPPPPDAALPHSDSAAPSPLTK